MECGKLESLIDAYLDRALSTESAQDVESHLAGCVECRSKYGGLIALLRSPKPAVAPAGLRGRIMTAVQQQAASGTMRESRPGRTRHARLRWAPWTGAAAASLMFFVLGWFGSRLWDRPLEQSTAGIEQTAPQQVTIVLSPWVLSSWAQAMALRAPANPALLVAQQAGMELVTARFFDAASDLQERRRPTSRPMPPSEPTPESELIPILTPVFRL